ncbi:rod shape-determining protein MreD [Maledivibacter halophilus]|uniref:Rod shape-determining protein MreD n=1 Tax=Maledivibacter halophilus TaxID=36842 RepID=A0A1T5KLZ6_9FIRM|nr:rod shape-determining protein MreD [Maledivibacter halophilus]SKC64479.1 rod shape-determining protein MreD [Maledivibacter halophilus]
MSGYSMFVIIIINFILQSTVFQHFRIGGILPNTALIIVVSISILSGRKKGVTAGIIAGILQDIFFSKAIGINILIYSFLGYLIGGLESRLFKDNYITPLILMILSTFFYHGIYFVLMHFLRHRVDYISILRTVIFTESIYNSIVGILIYRIFFNRVYGYK